MEYVGTRTQYPPTDFSGLQKSVEELLRNNAVRAPRQPEVVLKALQVIYMTEQVNIFPLHGATFCSQYEVLRSYLKFACWVQKIKVPEKK